MLKPIVVLTEKGIRKDAPTYIADHFIESGFYPLWSSFQIADVTKVKDKTELFLLMMPKTMSDDAKQICFYLRDIGIDEEKVVYICGSADMLSQAKKLIPSMIVKGSYEIEAGEFGFVPHEIRRSCPDMEGKKGCLILDDDKTYDASLYLSLKEYCDVAISDGSASDTAVYLADADLLLLSADIKLDYLEWAKVRALIARRKKTGNIDIVYLAKDADRQKEVNRYLTADGICLSKETDFLKNANYIVKRFFV